MKVLGLVASARRLGNSEVLVKEVLAGVREAAVRGGTAVRGEAAIAGGAEEPVKLSLVRLTDLRIQPCDGCMACVFSRQTQATGPVEACRQVGGQRWCRQDDDIPWLFEKMTEADGLVLGAPTYVLGPAGIVKMVLDRYLMLGHEVARLGSRNRRGVAISVAGLEGWNPLGVGPLSLLLLAVQAPPVGWLQAYAPGPAEVLLDPETVARARSLGHDLYQALCHPYSSVSSTLATHPPAAMAQPGAIAQAGVVARAGALGQTEEVVTCPYCGSQVLRVLKGEVECPVCACRAPLEADGSVGAFRPPGAHGHRWDPIPAQEHIEGWVMSTRERFLARREAIKPLRAQYRNMDDWWIAPPRSVTPSPGAELV